MPAYASPAICEGRGFHVYSWDTFRCVVCGTIDVDSVETPED